MPENLESLDYVHTSGGFLSPSLLSEAVAQSTRKNEFAPNSFVLGEEDSATPSGHAEDLETAFQLAQETYDSIANQLEEMEVGPLRNKWLVPILILLGYEPVVQRSHLRSSDGRESFIISHLGWTGDSPTPLILAKGDLDSVPARGQRSPHDELQRYLNTERGDGGSPKWGIVANGRTVRILREFHHTHLKGFIEFDLHGLFEARDFPSFRALYRLAHRSRFLPKEEGKSLLDILFEESQKEGVQIGRHLQSQVQEAIEALAEGLFGQDLRDLLDDPKEARSLFHEQLLIIYRILFMLFAEQRGMLPAEGVYAETYSLSALTRISERKNADPNHRDLWEGLKVAFQMLGAGAEEVGVFPYNGQLFDLSRTGRLMERPCENRFLLKAIQKLTHVTISGMRQRVNYAELGVEELGSVYESLLSYTLAKGESPGPAVALKPLTTERKDLGAYYTPPALVDFVLSVSLDRLIEERLEAAGPDRENRERALLDIRVCDPSCGSGAFLVGAIDRLSVALATEQAGGEKPGEPDVQQGRRLVLQHCIYGVDKDLFAVELCKVALWIHCAVKDFPLSFLDHRIQHGDSLVGWPLLEQPREIPSGAFSIPSKISNSSRPEDQLLKEFLRKAARLNDEILEGQQGLFDDLPTPNLAVDYPEVLREDERVPADVERKTRAYEGYLRSEAHKKFKAAADIWTAAFFWGPESGVRVPTAADYARALKGQADPELTETAAQILEEFPAFHWPLAFPEIRERGGFDCMVGNPPWEQVKLSEEEWFLPLAPEIAALRTAARRTAIERLEESDPDLFTKWITAKTAYDRMAEFCRNAGRFLSSGHEPNTYLLFSDFFADSIRLGGRVGVVLKSAVVLDKSASSVLEKWVIKRLLEEVHDIVNGKSGAIVFPAVAAVERFSVVALMNRGESNHFNATLMSGSIEEAIAKIPLRFDPEMLGTLNPKTKTLVSFPNESQLGIALQIHRDFPILDFEDGGENSWELNYVRLFDSSLGQRFFKKPEELESNGWTLGPDKIFRKPKTKTKNPHPLFPTDDAKEELALPLYEGQLANRYDHRIKTYETYTGNNKYGRKPHVPLSTLEQKSDPSFEMEPRYWMMADTANRRIEDKIGSKVMIGFRDVSRPWTEQRCAKAAILPRYPATHKLPVLGIPPEIAFEFLGIFNSATFDFLVRGHLPGASVALVWMLAQIPAPKPGLDPRIGENAKKLSLTSYSVANLFDREPHAWDPQERYQLDVETDALVAHAYRVTREQYEIILDSFEVMARMQVREHGRYKFKEDCLEMYGRVG